MTTNFKLNLKTDGLASKLIFKFWKHSEGLHRGHKPANRCQESEQKIIVHCRAQLSIL